MEQIVNQILDLAESLDERGNDLLAEALDKVASNLIQIKTAQYIGSQGYWVRNTRCWSNCYRQKRASNPKMPAQKVWENCHKEYVQYVDNFNSNKSTDVWDKYADSHTSLKKVASLDARLAKSIKKKTDNGDDLGVAIFASIEEMKTACEESFVDQCNALFSLATENFQSNPQDAIKIANIANDLVKESNLFQKIKDNVGGRMDTRKDYKSERQQRQQINIFNRNLQTAANQLRKAIENYHGQVGSLRGTLQKNLDQARTPQQKQEAKVNLMGLDYLSKSVLSADVFDQMWNNIQNKLQYIRDKQVASPNSNQVKAPQVDNPSTPNNDPSSYSENTVTNYHSTTPVINNFEQLRSPQAVSAVTNSFSSFQDFQEELKAIRDTTGGDSATRRNSTEPSSYANSQYFDLLKVANSLPNNFHKLIADMTHEEFNRYMQFMKEQFQMSSAKFVSEPQTINNPNNIVGPGINQ